jgi:hypothetical protein
MRAGSSVIESADVVFDLGGMIDIQLSMRQHARLRLLKLASLPGPVGSIGRSALSSLIVTSLRSWSSNLGFRDSTTAMLYYTLVIDNAAKLAQLKLVLYTTTRVVSGLRSHNHVAPTPKELHWLTMAQRVDYKLCLFVHKAST